MTEAEKIQRSPIFRISLVAIGCTLIGWNLGWQVGLGFAFLMTFLGTTVNSAATDLITTQLGLTDLVSKSHVKLVGSIKSMSSNIALELSHPREVPEQKGSAQNEERVS